MSELTDLSVILITKNEELNLRRCLHSLPEGVEIVVVDSQSSDGTLAIAKEFGAKVYQKEFVDFASQKNEALSKATRPWVLSLDADEELIGPVAQALQTAIGNSNTAGYRLPRHLVFMNRHLRFGKTKDAPLRLFQRSKGKFSGAIHEEVDLGGGAVKRLSGLTLLHYSYRDLSDYFARFNRYTNAIASNPTAQGKTVPMLSHIFRPWIEFFTRYVLRLGFLDGYPGYTYALISSLYAYIKYAKLNELRDSHD